MLYVTKSVSVEQLKKNYKTLRGKVLIKLATFDLFPVNISTLFQRCFLVDITSRSCTSSNKRWSNVVYVKDGIYNVEKRRINVVYFNVDFNNVRQRRNNVVIFIVDLHNVEPRRNNVLNMTIRKMENWTSSQEHNNTLEFQ